MNTKKLSDKVALVTGGTSGIGKTTATEFARAGAKVVLSGRREKEGADVVAEIQQLGGAAAFIRADVAKDAGPIKNTCRNRNIMNRTIEVDFLPRAFEEAKEKSRILIIDNNRDFAHSAKLALEGTGRYFVYEENDGSKAHQTAQGLKPDLILLDIAMPETDGGEVTARIESDPALHRTPIVFLTARDES